MPADEDAEVVVRTFLIADVRSYTRFTQTHGDEEAGRLAARFAALTREAVLPTGGELVELRGDEALCAFSSSRQALRAAVELQRRFRQRVDGEPVFPLGIGIGLAAGEAVPVEGGYRGGALNLAARLCSVAAPGQILASETVTSLAGRFEGARFVERRGLRLKGLDRPTGAVEVVPDPPPPPVPEAPAPGRRVRRPLAALAGGIVTVAAIAAAVVFLATGSDRSGRVENAIAAIGPDGAVSYTEVGTTPSSISVGEGGVWVLNADDRTISRIDPETTAVRTFGTGGIPTDLAVGEGAIWIGNGAVKAPGQGLANLYTASVSRFDPGSTAPSQTAQLPGRVAPGEENAGEYRVVGASQLAAGAGAVWAVNPDFSVSRIDPATGEVVARIPVRAAAIAAGREGVWALSATGPEVVQIDHKRNKVRRPIQLSADRLWDLAVGAGSVWTTDFVTGVLWRLQPGLAPRPIEIGFGINSVSYGGGAIWVTNFVSDEIVRVDPRTSKVTSRLVLAGTPPSVAADAETAWVPVVGAPKGDALPASACSAVEAGGQEPDLLIASDLPLQGFIGQITRTAADAIRFLLRKQGFRAGPHSVGYQSCDASTGQTGQSDFFKCASNAKAYAATQRLVGVIGPYNSQCAWVQIRIANRAEGGPLAMVSPSNTHSGLTRPGPDSGAEEPDTYYPTGVRNYFRVTGPFDLDGAAGAVLADELGLRRVFVLRSAEGLGEAATTPFRRAARRLGITIVGSATWDPDARSYRSLATRVAAARPDGVFIGEMLVANSGEVVKALRARLGSRVVLIASEAIQPIGELLGAAGRAAVGMYVTTSAVAHEGLSRAGRQFVRDFGKTRPDGVAPSAIHVTETAQAAEVFLAAIARSDGTRASVLEELRRLELKNGILGSFRFDENGDITPTSFTVLRVTGGDTRAPELPEILAGAVVDRVVRVRPSLARP